MGSIVSFPILCLLNATIMRVSFELATGVPTWLDEMSAAINGDDVTWRGKPKVYHAWQQVAKFFGMEESIGKTFLSDQFVQMNSRNFQVVNGLLYQSQFLNWGLVRNLGRSGDGGLAETTGLQISPSARYQELIKHTPDNLKQNIHNLFVKHNRQSLEGLRLPWYLPTWLGGLGLTGVMEPSDADLRIANGFIRAFAQKRRNGSAAPGVELPKDISVGSALWTMRIKAQKNLPTPFYTQDESDVGVEKYTNAVFEEQVSLIFDSTVNLRDIFPTARTYVDDRGVLVTASDKETPSNLNAAVKWNRRIWRAAYRKGKPSRKTYFAPIRFRGPELDKIKFYETYHLPTTTVDVAND